MESEQRPEDREHDRRWRRSPFAPATFIGPLGGAGGSGTREPRDRGPESGGASDAADAERPPSSG